MCNCALQQEQSKDEKLRLIRPCNGHPLALHLMRRLADTDYTPTTEATKISPTDVVGEINSVLFDGMFGKAFDELADAKKLVLYAVALFDQGAPLAAIRFVRL